VGGGDHKDHRELVLTGKQELLRVGALCHLS
jgi:hypothetical protein